MNRIRRVGTTISAVLKLVGCWVGPAFILVAVYLFAFAPMPFVDASQGAAVAGAILTGIACVFLRGPEWRRRRTIMTVAALLAVTLSGWRYWELRRGYHEE